MIQIVPGLWDIEEIGNSVHAYAWEWENGITLIDTGMPGSADAIMHALASEGFGPSDVQRIIITHMDIDHVGGVKALKRITGAPIACHSVEKSLLMHPRRRQPARTPLGLAIRPFYQAALSLPSFHVDPVTPDEIYVEGATLPEGLTVIHTPGHTPGHISLLSREKRVLIAGDVLSTRGGNLHEPPRLFTPDRETIHRSIWKLWKKYSRDLDVMVFGHGEPLRGDIEIALKRLVDTYFEQEATP